MVFTVDFAAYEQLVLNWFYICVPSVAFFGCQLSWALQAGFVTPQLEELGVSDTMIGIVWLAGPLSGIVVQPIVGILSDNLTAEQVQRFGGRRRPFIKCGCGLLVVGLLLFSNAKYIGNLFGDTSNESNFGCTIAIISFWFLDISTNVLQAPLRALLSDIIPIEYQSTANSIFGFEHGFGAMVASIMGFTLSYNDALDGGISLLFLIGAILVIIGSMITLSFSKYEQKLPIQSLSYEYFVNYTQNKTKNKYKNKNKNRNNNIINSYNNAKQQKTQFVNNNSNNNNNNNFNSSTTRIGIKITQQSKQRMDRSLDKKLDAENSDDSCQDEYHDYDAIRSERRMLIIPERREENKNTNININSNPIMAQQEAEKQQLIINSSNNNSTSSSLQSLVLLGSSCVSGQNRNIRIAQSHTQNVSNTNGRFSKIGEFWIEVASCSIPTPITRAFIVKFCDYFALFSQTLYTSDWFGKNITNGSPNGRKNEIILYHKGVKFANVGFGIMAFLSMFVSILLPNMIIKYGYKRTYMFCMFEFGINLIILSYVGSSNNVYDHVGNSNSHSNVRDIDYFTVGLAIFLLSFNCVTFAASQIVGWSIVTDTITNSNKKGIYTTFFNMANCLPQILASLVSPMILTYFNHDLSYMMFVAGLGAICGGFMSCFIVEPKDWLLNNQKFNVT